MLSSLLDQLSLKKITDRSFRYASPLYRLLLASIQTRANFFTNSQHRLLPVRARRLRLFCQIFDAHGHRLSFRFLVNFSVRFCVVDYSPGQRIQRIIY